MDSLDDDEAIDGARAQLDITSELLRAIDLMDEINAVVRSSEDTNEACRWLIDSPFGFTEHVAYHVLDLQVRRQTKAARRDLESEADRCRRFLEDGVMSPAPPRRRSGPAGILVDPGSPDRFDRLIIGPDLEVSVAAGTIRVIAVELYDGSMAIQWRHVQDANDEQLPSFGMAPLITDDLGNDYPAVVDERHGSVIVGEHVGRLQCFARPPTNASQLIVRWGHHVIAVPITT